MRRLLPLLSLLMLLPSAANAAGWVAEMVDDEGGPLLTAYVESEAPNVWVPRLSFICGTEAGLRYLPSVDAGAPDTAIDFAFSNETDEITLPMQYEAMDGAFGAYFAKDAEIIGLLKSGVDLLIRSSDASVPPQTFSLAGSSAAIDKVLAGCQ